MTCPVVIGVDLITIVQGQVVHQVVLVVQVETTAPVVEAVSNH